MPPVVAAAAIGAVGAIGGGLIASSGARSAANAQTQADQQAIGEQQREFNINQANYAPFLSAGQSALRGFGDLVGTNGNPAQQTAITALQGSPYYQSLYRNEQQAVLANASSTGGIRGGNTQLSLANFGADTLAATIQQQLQNLGGLAGMGLQATGGNAQAGQNSTNAISNLLQSQGAANAGASLASSGAWISALKSLTGSLSGLPGLGSTGYNLANNGSQGQIEVNPNWTSQYPGPF